MKIIRAGSSVLDYHVIARSAATKQSLVLVLLPEFRFGMFSLTKVVLCHNLKQFLKSTTLHENIINKSEFSNEDKDKIASPR